MCREDRASRDFTWFDRQGMELGKVGGRSRQTAVSLSPDGNTVVVNREEGTKNSFWAHDLVRGAEIRLTPASDARLPGGAVWASGGGYFWVSLNGPGGAGLYRKNLKDGGLELRRESRTRHREDTFRFIGATASLPFIPK